jgi:hypothetical protein
MSAVLPVPTVNSIRRYLSHPLLRYQRREFAGIADVNGAQFDAQGWRERLDRAELRETGRDAKLTKDRRSRYARREPP